MNDLARLSHVIENFHPEASRPAVQRVLLIDTTASPELKARLAELFPQADIQTGLEASAGPVDFMLVRHPDITFKRAEWAKTFEAGFETLSVDGTLIASTELLPDAAFIDGVLSSLPATLVPGSPYTAVPTSLKGWDRFILVFTKHI